MDLTLFEGAAFALCTSASSEERGRAEETIGNLMRLFQTANSTVSPLTSSLTFFERYLEQVTSPYAQFILFSRLKDFLHSKVSTLGVQELLETRHFILRFLSSKPDLEHFVQVTVYQAFGVLTVLAWFLDPEFQKVHEDVSKFLSATMPFQLVGMGILNATVMEMNYATSSVKSLPKHRKIAVSFRDSQLLPIFKTGLDYLNYILSQTSQGTPYSKTEVRLQEVTLNLIKNCLGFDFLGTNPDEASDDINSSQIPQSWKGKVLDPSTMEAFFQSFLLFNESVKIRAMECLSILAGARRSLFTDEERASVLTRILGICVRLMQQLQNDPESNECHHEFCRMLARMNQVHLAKEILAEASFSSFCRLLTPYTVDRLQHQWELNTLIYILNFWERLASSIPYSLKSRSSTQSALAEEVHVVFTAFVSKMDSDSGIEVIQGLLDKEDDFCLFLDLVASLVRTNYETHSQLLEAKMTYWIPQYESYFRAFSPVHQPTAIENTQAERMATALAFTVYVSGAAIGARRAYESTDDHDYLDGVLASSVLQMMTQLGQLTQYVHEALELAFLKFFQIFREVYLGESTYRGSQVYKRLSETLQLSDKNEVMEVFLQKIGCNLKYGSYQKRVIDRTLDLLLELSSGYSITRNLCKVETVKLMLKDPSSYLPFLETNSHSKSRTKYYSALAKILFAGDIEEEDFNNFVNPLTITLKRLAEVKDPRSLSQPQVRDAAEGLFRDIRGLLSGTLVKKAYMFIFDWFFPYFELVHGLLEANFQDTLCIVILRFVAEFVNNSSSRLSFDNSSPNGVLIFKHISRLLANSALLLTRQPEPTSSFIWQLKYKKILLLFQIFKRTLIGRYVPFGVFRVFNDPSVDRAVQSFFQMMTLIPESDLLCYTKLSESFFSCLCALSGKQLFYMQDIEKPVLEYIISVCALAINSKPEQSSEACRTIDNLISFVIQQGPKPHILSARFREIDNSIHAVQIAIWEAILLNEPDNLWSLTGALFPLILYDRPFFSQYIEMLCLNQPFESRQKLAEGFRSIFDGLDGKLTVKNRNRFMDYVQNFRRDLTNEQIHLS